MKLIKSVCSTIVFPNSRKNIVELEKVVKYLKNDNVHVMEFYYDGMDKIELKRIIEENDLHAVYVGVIPSKESKLHMCDTNEVKRVEAVNLFKKCADEAHIYGFKELMMNSGANMDDSDLAFESLCKSIKELYNYIQENNYGLKLLLEPCDSEMDACQFVGSYELTYKLAKKLNDEGVKLYITYDTAHTIEEGQNFIDGLTLLKPFCNQIHFANCHIEDKNDPLYGDKHVGFDDKEGFWNVDALKVLYPQLVTLYKGEDLRIAFEYFCRENDSYEYYNKTKSIMSFMTEE